MKNSSFLQQLCPRCHERFSGLPVIGELVNAYLHWLIQRDYARSSLRNHLNSLRQLSRWLLRRRIRSLATLDQQILSKAHEDFWRSRSYVRGTISAFKLFLREQAAVREGRPDQPSASDVELARFGTYLREVRGLAEGTVLAHQRRLRPFLRFVRFDQCPTALSNVSSG